MEPIESSETSAYNNTLTPGTYPKEKKLRTNLPFSVSHIGHVIDKYGTQIGNVIIVFKLFTIPTQYLTHY